MVTIEAKIVDYHVVIPYGMKPVTARKRDGKMLAHVDGWTPEREYDGNRFQLYSLTQATHFEVELKVNDETSRQDWYVAFGEPAKEARMGAEGELTIRPQHMTA